MILKQIGNQGGYSAPAIEFLDIETEKGFAQSTDSAGYGETPIDNGDY